ncbi:hypothetical protein SCLCIDRAFT_138128, partial [Scleroderma citrinum Foug A]
AIVCKEEGLKPFELVKWIHTLNKFCLVADNTSKVPKLRGNRKYLDYAISEEEWQMLELIHEVLKFHKLKKSIGKGLEKMKKYYRFLDQNNVAFICLALDPNFKLEYVKDSWESEYFEQGMNALHKAVSCFKLTLISMFKYI